MDKLTMAHDWAMKHIQEGWDINYDVLVIDAWRYADAMQAEADERINKERPDVLLTKDKDGNCLHFHREFGHKKCMDCGASLEEWQPDWSQAPDNANYWAMDKDGSANFFRRNPEITNGNGWDFGGVMQANNTHGYIGNWKDSLRKRPEALKSEIDWSQAPNDAIGWMVFDGSSTWLGEFGFLIEEAPSFGFTGSHIVERPHGF